MHRLSLPLSLLACALAGCATPRPAPSAAPPKVRLVPDERLHGRIATVNTTGQFVVVDFNVGAMPPLGTKLNVYRTNEVVGVVRLTGPVQENFVAGDIVRGEAAAGDRAIWDREPEQDLETKSP